MRPACELDIEAAVDIREWLKEHETYRLSTLLHRLKLGMNNVNWVIGG